jgi:hypothetical protein
LVLLIAHRESNSLSLLVLLALLLVQLWLMVYRIRMIAHIIARDHTMLHNHTMRRVLHTIHMCITLRVVRSATLLIVARLTEFVKNESVTKQSLL